MAELKDITSLMEFKDTLVSLRDVVSSLVDEKVVALNNMKNEIELLTKVAQQMELEKMLRTSVRNTKEMKNKLAKETAEVLNTTKKTIDGYL